MTLIQYHNGFKFRFTDFELNYQWDEDNEKFEATAYFSKYNCTIIKGLKDEIHNTI